MSSKKLRTFEVLDKETGTSHGTYVSNAPRRAAIKAFSEKMKRDSATGDATDEEIWIREITKGSSNTTYKYSVQREKLSEPKIVTLTGKQIEFEYDTKATALKHDD